MVRNQANNRDTIGGLAKAAGVGVETVRYYQRRGLLSEPARPLGEIRRYGEDDVKRLKFIRSAQAAGFTLGEIGELSRSMLPTTAPAPASLRNPEWRRSTKRSPNYRPPATRCPDWPAIAQRSAAGRARSSEHSTPGQHCLDWQPAIVTACMP